MVARPVEGDGQDAVSGFLGTCGLMVPDIKNLKWGLCRAGELGNLARDLVQETCRRAQMTSAGRR